MTQPTRINNSESCVVCSRRADGVAVGRPTRLGWYCLECGATTAQAILHANDFDVYETRAAERVASQIEGDLRVPAVELPAFIKWMIDEFAKAIRNEVKSDGAPF